MTHFLKNGNTYRVSNDENMNVFDVLPVGNYAVKEHPMLGLYLEKIDDFTRPSKIYGKSTRHASRIINTFNDRTNGTGVILSGDKGSGKTLLAKIISMDCAVDGIPTIVVNSPFVGDDFNKLLQDITQPCIILFDEFEKVYDREQQEQILTLLDGVYTSKKLYLFTINDTFKLDFNLRNRPGRIFYSLEFNGVDETFIREYCEDRLNDTTHIDQICDISKMFDSFNFDILAALVEEMNRYNEKPADALEMLNAKPEYSNDMTYAVTLTINGHNVKERNSRSEITFNPLVEDHEYGFYDKITNPDESEWRSVNLDPESISKIDYRSGRIVYEFEDVVVILTRKDSKKSGFRSFMAF